MTSVAQSGGIRDRFLLTDRVAVITGCGSGIGRAIALAFAEAGADVVGLDISDDGGRATIEGVEARGRRGSFLNCDVASTGEVERAFEAVDRSFGRVDLLVNDAARGSHTHPLELTDGEWEGVLAVTLSGYFRCSRAAARRMAESGRGGAIVNISSIAGSSALGRGNFAYSVAKGGVNQMTRELAVEWAPQGIRVNAIQPCQVGTSGLLRLLADEEGRFHGEMRSTVLRGIPLGRVVEPEEIAAAAVFLASDAASMITGCLLPVDGGNLALNAGGTVAW